MPRSLLAVKVNRFVLVTDGAHQVRFRYVYASALVSRLMAKRCSELLHRYRLNASDKHVFSRFLSCSDSSYFMVQLLTVC